MQQIDCLEASLSMLVLHSLLCCAAGHTNTRIVAWLHFVLSLVQYPGIRSARWANVCNLTALAEQLG